MTENLEFEPSYPDHDAELFESPNRPRRKFRWGCLGLILLVFLVTTCVFLLMGPEIVARSSETIAIYPVPRTDAVPVVDLQLLIWPDRIKVVNDKAHSEWSFSRSDAAMQLAYTALQVWPQSADLHNTLGQIYFVKNLPEWAIYQFESALNLDKNLATVHNNLGVTLIELNKPAEAVSHLQKAVALDPGNSTAMVNLSSAFLKAGKSDEAFNIVQQVVAQDAQNINAWLLMGRIYLNQADFEAADETFNKALEIKPSSYLAQQGKGIVALHKGDANLAAAYLQAALKGDVRDAFTHFYLGSALELLGQRSEAIKHFEQTLSLTSNPGIIKSTKDHLNSQSLSNQTSIVSQGGEPSQ